MTKWTAILCAFVLLSLVHLAFAQPARATATFPKSPEVVDGGTSQVFIFTTDDWATQKVVKVDALRVAADGRVPCKNPAFSDLDSKHSFKDFFDFSCSSEKGVLKNTVKLKKLPPVRLEFTATQECLNVVGMENRKIGVKVVFEPETQKIAELELQLPPFEKFMPKTYYEPVIKLAFVKLTFKDSVFLDKSMYKPEVRLGFDMSKEGLWPFVQKTGEFIREMSLGKTRLFPEKKEQLVILPEIKLDRRMNDFGQKDLISLLRNLQSKYPQYAGYALVIIMDGSSGPSKDIAGRGYVFTLDVNPYLDSRLPLSQNFHPIVATSNFQPLLDKGSGSKSEVVNIAHFILAHELLHNYNQGKLLLPDVYYHFGDAKSSYVRQDLYGEFSTYHAFGPAKVRLGWRKYRNVLPVLNRKVEVNVEDSCTSREVVRFPLGYVYSDSQATLAVRSLVVELRGTSNCLFDVMPNAGVRLYDVIETLNSIMLAQEKPDSRFLANLPFSEDEIRAVDKECPGKFEYSHSVYFSLNPSGDPCLERVRREKYEGEDYNVYLRSTDKRNKAKVNLEVGIKKLPAPLDYGQWKTKITLYNYNGMALKIDARSAHPETTGLHIWLNKAKQTSMTVRSRGRLSLACLFDENQLTEDEIARACAYGEKEYALRSEGVEDIKQPMEITISDDITEKTLNIDLKSWIVGRKKYRIQ